MQKITDYFLSPSKYLETYRGALNKAFRDKIIILLNRYDSFGRNTYGYSKSSALSPRIILSDTEWYNNIKVSNAFSKEAQTKKRFKDTQLNFEEIEKLLNSMLKNIHSDKCFNIWQNGEEIENYVSRIGGKILSVPNRVSTYLEDKNNFNEILKEAGILQKYCLKQLVFSDNNSWLDYQEIKNQLGDVFVIQSRGAGGRGTMIVRNLGEYNNAKKIFIDKVRVTQYFEGFSSNVNILTIPSLLVKNEPCYIYVDIPSFKATNIPEIGVSEVMSAGSDWNIPFPILFSHDFVKNVELIGSYLFKKHGLIGMWGLDSIWDKNGFVFNELNCRFQGTTEVSSINQWQRGIPPFYATHHLIFNNQVVDWMPPADEFNRNTVELMSNIEGYRPFYLKIKVKAPEAIKINSKLNGSGVYKIMSDQSLKKLNKNILTSSANFDKNEILIANLPGKDTACYPGSQLCTVEGIASNKKIFNGPHSLSKDGLRLEKIIYHYFN